MSPDRGTVATPSNWVNFAEIRASISLEDVIFRYYKIDTLKRDGEKLVGPCPIHRGDSPRAFHADLGRNVYHCFSRCKKGGNQLDFVAARDGISIRDAALRLQAYFLRPAVASGGAPPAASSRPKAEARAPPAAPASRAPEEPEENPVLNVKLDLRGDHPHLLQERGLQLSTVEHFGVGYCGRGIMKGTIAIPIHDEEGQLVAYAGRRLRYADIQELGKYKLPKGFKKDLVLYNLNRAREHLGTLGYLILVEGFFSVLKLYEYGFPNVVAAMGCDLSVGQARLLSEAREIIILFDGDEAGTAGARLARERLAKEIVVRVATLPSGAEPEALPPKALRWIINGLRLLDLADVSLSLRVPPQKE